MPLPRVAPIRGQPAASASCASSRPSPHFETLTLLGFKLRYARPVDAGSGLARLGSALRRIAALIGVPIRFRPVRITGAASPVRERAIGIGFRARQYIPGLVGLPAG